ncbi:MAG: T9SS type A sorting domain-containing protein [Bacteroidetes bacterium]|nr:MAG: T9SS type A sorting domain-containing protein [Bacteroidota bacterium]
MNNEKKNIEDYFLKARNQEPVLSGEDARSLIENFASNKRTVFGNIINYYKGAPIMFKLATIAAAAATVGIAAFNIASNDNNSNQVKENYLIRNDNSQTNNSNNNSLLTDSTEENQNNSEVNVKGVQIVKLQDTDLDKLGIKIDEKNPDNPKLIYWDTKGKKPILCTLYVKGGFSMSDDSKLSVEENNVPDFSPRLITDNAGNRRVFVLDDDGAHLIQAKYSSKFLSPFLKDSNKRVDEEETISLINRAVAENLDDDNNNKSIVKVISISDTSSKGSRKKYNNKRFKKNYDVEINVDSMVNDAYSKAMRVYTLKYNKNNIDSIMKEAMKKYDTSKKYLKYSRMNLDSLRHKFKVFKFDTSCALDFKWDTLFRGFESLDSLCFPNIIVPDIPNPDNLYEFHSFPELQDEYLKELEQDKQNVGKKIRKYRIRIEEYDDDSMKLDSSIKKLKDIKIKLNDMRLKELDNKLKNIEINIDKYIKINKLIPIEIPVKGESPRSYSFIFWYDPTPKLLEALPAEVRNKLEPEIKILQDADNICEAATIAGKDTYFDVWRSCSGALENLTVFPNPTSGKVNLSFTLLEPRMLSIILHDLSGRKIAELSAMKSFPSGDRSESFKLQDIEPGMYLISVRSDKGEQAVQRVIVE